jgi:threonine efflux protein
MAATSSLLVLAGVYLAVLASPGPNFFILSQLSLAGQRQQARYVVLGLTTGSVFWVVASLAGLSSLLNHHPWLAAGVRALGAAYLIWYGGRLLWSAISPAQESQNVSPPTTPGETRASAYKAGLLTGVTNPKGAAFWTSAFATLLPVDAPGWFYPATVAMIAGLSLFWHLGITVVFGTAALRSGYLRVERAVNGFAGGVLVGLGLHRMVVR